MKLPGLMLAIIALSECVLSLNLYGERLNDGDGTKTTCCYYDFPVCPGGMNVYDFRGNPDALGYGLEIGVNYHIAPLPVSDLEKQCDDVVVADVVSLNLIAITSLDGCRLETVPVGILGWYRVKFKTRKVLKGAFHDEWFTVAIPYGRGGDLYNKSWLYFRGITLKIGFVRQDGGRSMRFSSAVRPYEPYDAKGVRMFTHVVPRVIDSFFVKDGNLVANIVENKHDRPSFLALQFGTDTFALYSMGEKVVDIKLGWTDFSFYDFGETGTIKVWFNGPEANRDYWKYAWFADAPIDSPPRVELHEFNPTNKVDAIKPN